MADVLWRKPTDVFNEDNKFDPDTRSVSVVQSGDAATNAGYLYYGVATEDNIPNGDFRYLLIRSGELLPHWRSIWVAASKGPINLNLYERDEQLDLNSFSPNPVQIPTHNANRNSSNLAQAEIWSFDDTPPASPLGDLFLGNIYVPDNGGNGVSGETRLRGAVLKPFTDYILEVQNDPLKTGQVLISLFFEWLELPWSK